MPRTEKGLYDAIEAVMKKKPKEQFTAQVLWGLSDVRKHAPTQTRVSDYLGNMFRKGDVMRLPNPGIKNDTQSRYCYQWKGHAPVTAADPSTAIEYRSKKILLDRPEVRISENGNEISIETPALAIVIRTKK